MTSIRRIGSTDLTLSSPTRDKRTAAPAAALSKEIVVTVNPPRASAGLRLEQPHYRPAASFLTQYIDQHFRWPRAPHRKERQRQRATGAYLTADMLPDLLAETLRLRPIDKKI
ncbi:MAG: hypothetical protein Q7S99_02440 [Parvibaculum sp.]|nr:hypothetical protein [Parvibaculum sp.]|tara:strand:+ start:10601 stop:10939 length:339 start_codon:yes stop_codon:yes gene_type:complete